MKDRKLKDYVPLVLKGVAMGAADVVPGVSGGTMAFILGIYEELIYSIHTIASLDTLRLLLRGEFGKIYRDLPWRFLLAVGMGILTSIITLAAFIKWSLAVYPELLWAFFFGLVVASVVTVVSRVKSWTASRYFSLAAGAVSAFLIVTVTPADTPQNPWFLFFCGAVAICAMILPGISGSFLLVILGKYQYILGAVTGSISALKEKNFSDLFDKLLILFYVAAGAVVGLSTFVKLLDWLFKKYHDLTVSALIGFMIGSLWKIWPWKQTLETYIDRHGAVRPLVQKNILPELNSYFAICLIVSAVAFVAILFITRLSEKTESK